MEQDGPLDVPARADVERRAPVVETAPVEPQAAGAARLAAAVGNRSFSQMVSRLQDGDGILAGGVVHPAVEAAITAATGRGRPLDRGVAGTAGDRLGDTFEDVRIHADEHAAALSSAVSARAFTVGRDIFFAAGEYQAETADGRQLLTHELAHVVQQRGAPASGPLTVSEPGDALEQEAEAAARGL